jgi:UDP-N-acetylglucosamine acyltransferase
MPIHPTAIVDPRARIAESADIGPYSIIGAEVEIGARTRLMANAYIEGPTWIGEDNIFFPFSSIGVASQDLKYKGERAETHIGRPQPHPRIRHHPSRHRGRRTGHHASAAITCS